MAHRRPGRNQWKPPRAPRSPSLSASVFPSPSTIDHRSRYNVDPLAEAGDASDPLGRFHVLIERIVTFTQGTAVAAVVDLPPTHGCHHEAALSLATAQLAAAHAEALAALAAREADIAALQAQLRQVTAERDALRAAASRHPSGADAAVDPAVEASGLSEDGGKVPLSHADSAPWTARDRCRDATVRVSPVALAPKRRRAGGPVERDPGLGPDPEDQKRLRLSQAATQACPLGWPSYANDARDDERGGRGDDGGGLIDRNSKDMPEDVPPGSPESPERSPEEPRPPAASIELPEARKAPPARSRRVARSPPSPQMAMAAADPPPSAPQPSAAPRRERRVGPMAARRSSVARGLREGATGAHGACTRRIGGCGIGGRGIDGRGIDDRRIDGRDRIDAAAFVRKRGSELRRRRPRPPA
ncbi:hypothetical protein CAUPRSCDRAFT_11019 [Caulochytrium protostelioides]|uniref:Uncharacterized protein n=1 Tax=Caulochytrium protostelioides TaxID=1555241 RepID=A0A4P9WX41_9FUNG|nr:hypothetical protein CAUPRSCDRAFT_11019 [Caulochytrium protostelioides]